MRSSNFILPVAALPAVVQATKTDRTIPFPQMLRLRMAEAHYDGIGQSFEQHLSDESTLTAREIKKAPPPAHSTYGELASSVMPQICAEGRLARAKVRGGCKGDLYESALFDRGLPGVKGGEIAPGPGRVALAREHFDNYGPATGEDSRWWSG